MKTSSSWVIRSILSRSPGWTSGAAGGTCPFRVRSNAQAPETTGRHEYNRQIDVPAITFRPFSVKIKKLNALTTK